MDWKQFDKVIVKYEQGRALDFSFPYGHTFPGEFNEVELYHVNTLIRSPFRNIPVITMFDNGRSIIFDIPPVEIIVNYFTRLARGSPKKADRLIEVESAEMPSDIDPWHSNRYFGSLTKSEVLENSVTKDFCYVFLPAWQGGEQTRAAMYRAYMLAKARGSWY